MVGAVLRRHGQLPWPEAPPVGGAAGDAQALLLRSTTTEAGRFIRTVLDALHRQDLLGRIFAPERLQALLAACGEPAKEAA